MVPVGTFCFSAYITTSCELSNSWCQFQQTIYRQYGWKGQGLYGAPQILETQINKCMFMRKCLFVVVVFSFLFFFLLFFLLFLYFLLTLIFFFNCLLSGAIYSHGSILGSSSMLQDQYYEEKSYQDVVKIRRSEVFLLYSDLAGVLLLHPTLYLYLILR